MLISTQTTLALRCPSCGKLGFYTLSRFAVNNGKRGRYTCECGASMAVIGSKNKREVLLQVECMLCEQSHIMTYKASRLWDNKVKSVLCEESGLETGFIGPCEQVKDCVQHLDRSMQEMAEDMGYDKYFLNPDVMYKVLEQLKKMTEEGKVFCSCEAGELEIEAYPDRIELYCTSCDAIGVISAETKEDLEWVSKLDRLVLEEQKQSYFNLKWNKKRGRTNRRNT